MRLVGADEELPDKSHYFVGNHPAAWRTNVLSYAKVRYEDVYPGIDLVFYGGERRLEYDFVVAPGADPEVIQLAFQGSEKVELDHEGHLAMDTGNGQMRFKRPFVYQEMDGVRREVGDSYLRSKGSGS
jgi:hypothetical protein